MKLPVPVHLTQFAVEFSEAKTPIVRTQGWVELPHEQRGDGDKLDTIGTLMLWQYLVSRGVPTTYHLTAGMGDETDLRSKVRGETFDINVKTSKWAARNDEAICELCHIPMKAVELQKALPAVLAEVIVHVDLMNPSAADHVHLCGWIACESATFQRQQVRTIPNTNGARGYWIPSRDAHKVQDLPTFLLGTPEERLAFLR